MVDDIAKAVAMLFVRMIKPTIAVLRWTYLWIVFGAVAILGVLPWAWLQALVMLLALVLWVLLFLQRIIRLITRNPSFSIFRCYSILFYHKNKVSHISHFTFFCFMIE